MVDSLGHRRKFGVLAPSTNTSVEPEFAMMQPRGVTNHFCRIEIPDNPIKNDSDFEALMDNIRETTMSAADRLMTCRPDYVVMGMSAETFWDGAEGSEQLLQRMEERCGVGVAMGSHACRESLRIYSEEKPIKTVGVLTPYMPVGDNQVRGFFSDIGYDVKALIGLKCQSPVLIAHEQPETLRKAITELNEAGVDAIVQVGTNLACAKVSEEAERWFNKPVVAINVATYWYALRYNGIKDQVEGFGRLLAEY